MKLTVTPTRFNMKVHERSYFRMLHEIGRMWTWKGTKIADHWDSMFIVSWAYHTPS